MSWTGADSVNRLCWSTGTKWITEQHRNGGKRSRCCVAESALQVNTAMPPVAVFYAAALRSAPLCSALLRLRYVSSTSFAFFRICYVFLGGGGGGGWVGSGGAGLLRRRRRSLRTLRRVRPLRHRRCFNPILSHRVLKYTEDMISYRINWRRLCPARIYGLFHWLPGWISRNWWEPN